MHPSRLCHSFLLIVSLGLLLLTASGCFRQHCYRAHPYSLCQTDIAPNVGAALSTSAVAPGEIFYESWWNFFQDPQLSHFIELSLACHPDIHIAESRIRQACHEANVARSALLPHVFFAGDIRRQKVSETAPGFVPGFPDLFTEATLELVSTFELDIWNKNTNRYYSELDQVQAEIANFEEAKLLLSTTIAAYYFDLQMKLARKEIAEKRYKARDELYQLLKQQFDLGIISEFRVYEVHTDVQLLKDFIYTLEAEIAIDLHALSALVGNTGCTCGPDGRLLVQPSAQFKVPFPLPHTLPIDLLARRPDVTARKWLVESACYDIKVAKADFFPRIDLIGWLGVQSIRLDHLLTGKSLIAMGSATLTLPLFLAGKLQAKLGIARETLEQAIEGYNQTVLNAVQEVSDALSDLVISDERRDAIERAIKDAFNLYELTEQKFKKGVYNKLTVLNALENLYIQEDLEMQIQLARFESAVKLIRAIGGGYYECTRR